MQQQSLATEAIEARQESRRASVLRVRCHCTNEQEFVQRYAADICAGGMFLRTRQPLPVGARVRFELLLQSGRCALGGVGRVAWTREADAEQEHCAGGGVAFERLRRGDRAVIERMDGLRGSAPSRFEQPEARHVEAPHGAELAKTLFADLAGRIGTDPGAAAFLSADLSKELGDGGWRRGARADGPERPIADLAEQLEPRAEPRDEDVDDEPSADVELVPPPAREPAAAHSTVRPAPLSSSTLRRRLASASRAAKPAGSAVQTSSPHAPAQPQGAVYAVAADSAVSLALARRAVSAVSARKMPVSAEPMGAVIGRVNGDVQRRMPKPPARARRSSAAPVAVPRPVPVSQPTLPVIAEPAPAPSPTPVQRRASAAPLVFMLSAVIVLASCVTYLALSDRLSHLLAWLGL